MPAIGIFIIPATPSAGADTLSPYQRIFNNLLLDHHLEPLPHWTLEHRLFRETAPISAGESVPATPTAGAGVLQVLTLSHHAGSSYATIGRINSAGTGATTTTAPPVRPGGPNAGKPASTAVPPPPLVLRTDTPLVTLPSAGAAGTGAAGADELTALLTARFAPLWTRRGTLHVGQGPAYRAGANIVVRFGELREARGPQQQAQQQSPQLQQMQQQGQQGQQGGGGGQQQTPMMGAGIPRGTVVEVRYVSKSTGTTAAVAAGERADKEGKGDDDVAMANGNGNTNADATGEGETKEFEEVAELRKFWASLNVAGAREFVTRHEKDDTMPVRLWLEALKPR